MGLAELESLEDIESWVLGEWQRANHDRRHAFRWPALATVGPDGVPAARIVALRHFDRGARTLRFHTDARSAKVRDLCANPTAALLFFDRKRNIQVRATGTVRVLTEGAERDAALAACSPRQRQDYATRHAPGTPRNGPAADRDPALAERHFTVLLCELAIVDWLHLGREAHRRARFDFRGERCWLTP